jgi:hypothetical protein
VFIFQLLTVLEPSRQRRHSSSFIIIVIIILLSLLLVISDVSYWNFSYTEHLHYFTFRFTLTAFQVNRSFLMESIAGMTLYTITTEYLSQTNSQVPCFKRTWNFPQSPTWRPIQSLQTSSLFQKNLKFSPESNLKTHSVLTNKFLVSEELGIFPRVQPEDLFSPYKQDMPLQARWTKG